MKHSKELPIKAILVGTILAVIGLAISAYTLSHHLELKQNGFTHAACNINATFSCDDVAASKYAEPFGFPMGLFGIGYFAGMILLLLVSFFKEEFSKDNLITYKFMVIVGLITSIALFSISIMDIGAVCPTCLGIYTVCLLQVIALGLYRQSLPSGFELKSIFNGGTYQIATLAVTLIVFNTIESDSPKNFHPDKPQTEALDSTLPPQSLPDLMLEQKKHDITINRTKYSGLGEDFHYGNPDAKVVLVEFADFECPACRDAALTIRQLKQEMSDRLLVVFKNFPLDKKCNSGSGPIHQHACEAAIISRCAGRIGKFWQMHDLIFDNQRQLSPEQLTLWGKQLGLSDEQLSQCRASKDILAKLQDDIDQGRKADVSGTPSIYINGRKFTGAPRIETLRSLINQVSSGAL